VLNQMAHNTRTQPLDIYASVEYAQVARGDRISGTHTLPMGTRHRRRSPTGWGVPVRAYHRRRLEPRRRQPLMASGTIKWFDPNKGYGFIRPDRGSDVFVHISALQASGLQTVQEGQAVEFDIEPGRKGPRPPTCDHGRHARWDDAPPPATQVGGLDRCGVPLPAGRCGRSRSAAQVPTGCDRKGGRWAGC
jgi:cold shock protein